MRFDVFGGDTAPRQFDRAVDIGLGHGPAGIGLERDRLHHPMRAEAIEQRMKIGRFGRSERLVEAVLAFEHGRRTGEPGLRQQRRANARLRRIARVQPLGPAAIGKIFDDPGGKASGDSDRVRDLL